MFADDFAIFAETVNSMQLMINRLANYCRTWNLSVNLAKTKMMIFRNGGGRISRNEQWKYEGEQIEVVREYKYLGVLITANLNMKKHFVTKLSEAKRAIGSVWGRCIGNKYLSHSAKQKIIRATATSILLYGAQVWGYRSYTTLEVFQRYCVKRVFKLPNCTPNYMIHLETGMPPLFLETLKLHFDYVQKVMRMDEQRLPKKILSYLVMKKSNCVEEWETLARNGGLNTNYENIQHDQLYKILEKTGNSLYDSYVNEAQSSQYRMYYSKLNYNLQEATYFLNTNSAEKINIIFKIRGELAGLNYIPHRPDLPLECSLCNLKEREDVYHFIGKCPILCELRRIYFGANLVELVDVLGILNGDRGWDVLYKYTVNALHYRTRIIEGNF